MGLRGAAVGVLHPRDGALPWRRAEQRLRTAGTRLPHGRPAPMSGQRLPADAAVLELVPVGQATVQGPAEQLAVRA